MVVPPEPKPTNQPNKQMTTTDLRAALRADLRDSQLTAGQLAEEIIEQLTAASPVQP